jgi:peroxiredoxin
VFRKRRKLLAAGDRAPEFTLRDAAGASHKLADELANGPVLLALYKIGCPVCQLTLPYLNRLPTAGKLQVIAISQDNETGTERFRSNYGVTLPTLLDREEDGYAVSNAFGISQVPSLFLVEPDGAISMASEGFVKRDLEAIAERAGVEIFRQGEKVPDWKAG